MQIKISGIDYVPIKLMNINLQHVLITCLYDIYVRVMLVCIKYRSVMVRYCLGFALSMDTIFIVCLLGKVTLQLIELSVASIMALIFVYMALLL